MRVIIVGTGFVANMHAEILRDMGHELVAVVGRTLQSASFFSKKWQIPTYSTHLQEVVQESDCVHICTPPLLHYPQVRQALMAGKHVLCEKPLTISSNKAKELWELAKSKNVVAAVNFNVRFHQAGTHIKSIIRASDFGSIRMIHGSYLQDFHADNDIYNWRYQSEKGGPMRAVTEIGSHWIDLVRYCTDLEISSVLANFAHFQPERRLKKDGKIYEDITSEGKKIRVESEDAATLFLRFSNGAIGNVVLSEVHHGKKNELTLHITGSQQSIFWNNEIPYQIQIGQKNAGIKTLSHPFGGGFIDTFRQLFRAVYHHIGNRKSPIQFPTFEDGYRNALVCEAIYQSATTGNIWKNV